MKLSEVKKVLETVQELKFRLPNGNFVAKHFHVTEVGLITKNFIDCGGVVREEKKINFQLWEEKDYDHRLAPSKFINIIKLSEETLQLQDFEVEVEYQSDTIGKYHLGFENGVFFLETTLTDCLARNKCGIEEKPKKKVSLSDVGKQSACCDPSTGCC